MSDNHLDYYRRGYTGEVLVKCGWCCRHYFAKHGVSPTDNGFVSLDKSPHIESGVCPYVDERPVGQVAK